MPLVILLVIMAELNQQQVSGSHFLLRRFEQPFLPEASAAAPAEGQIPDRYALPDKFGQSPAPATERGLIIVHCGITDNPDYRHFCQSSITCFRSMVHTCAIPFASGLENRIISPFRLKDGC